MPPNRNESRLLLAAHILFMYVVRMLMEYGRGREEKTERAQRNRGFGRVERRVTVV